MYVAEYWIFDVLKNKWRAPVSVLASALLLGALLGCSDNSINTEIPDPLTPGEMLIGSWEFLEVSVDGVLRPMPENELFWYFVAPQIMCSLEKHSDGTYGPDLSGVYGVFESELIIKLGNGDQMNLQFAFSGNSDTLQIWENYEQHELVYSMMRVFDAPANEWCP
jgi:hypothetical protein